MDHSVKLITKILKWRKEKHNSIPCDKLEFFWSEVHFSIIHDYFLSLSSKCNFGELNYAKLFKVLHNAVPGSSLKIPASLANDIQHVFMVPRLNKIHENRKRIKKYQLVEAFISFLLQLLYHKPDSITGPCKDRIDNLEKKLRFLLTVLGDTPLVLCADEHEEFQNLLAEFEAVANEVGRLVHSLIFSIDRAFVKMDKGLSDVLNHIDLMEANIIEFLNLLPFISRSVYIMPENCVLNLLNVDSLVYDLEDLMNREDNMIANVKDQIKMLHQGLILVQSSIEGIGSPQPSAIGELKESLMQIGEMAHEAEFLIISFLVGDAPFWYFTNRLTNINDKIKLLGTELQEIKTKCNSGSLKAARYLSTQQAKRDSEVNDFTVGFEDKATYVLDQLVGGTDHLQVVSIYGMPGVGKTTLAKKVYNHCLFDYWFDKMSWCVISQRYQRKIILTEILIHIRNELSKDRILQMDEDSLIEDIYKTLKGRRYLVVLDDLWDSNVWDDLRRCFPDDANGSRVLFTTRNKDVAPPNSILYEKPLLSNDQCWELLQYKVFGNKPCPPDLVEIGERIAANCCGLPLAIVVIAGILSTMDKDKSTWEDVGGNLASYIFDSGDNSVMQILELSYKHLPEHLKSCFLYFGAFQEEKEIRVGKLTRLWIAEGFIRKEEKKTAENVAEEYLMELVDKSLVIVAERRSDGGVKACAIHDLLRDMCFEKSKEENFLRFTKSDIYSMHERRNLVLKYEAVSTFCQHVHFFCCSRVPTLSPFYVRDMRLVRVLHFDYIHHNHFIGIEYLVNLRYLVITDMPPSIASLVNLEYLRVEKNVVHLHPAIVKMVKLRYLEVPHCAIYDKDCSNSQTNNLEFLSRVWISEVKDEEMLKCSPHLRKLKCCCDRISMDKSAYGHLDFRFLTQLETLNIHISAHRMVEISFPSNIKKLTLSGSRLTNEEMSTIGRLENLEVLKLGFNSIGEERWDTTDGEFQKLRFLKICGVYFIEWNVASSEHFPKLQQLVLSYCYNLVEIPSEIGEIATLQLIKVLGECPKSLVGSAKRIQQEQKEMENEELRVITDRMDSSERLQKIKAEEKTCSK